MISQTIRRAVEAALGAQGADISTGPAFAVEHPDNLSHGDYATNAALVYSKALKTNPRALAEKLVAALRANLPADVEKIDIAGPGFINFHLKREFFSSQVSDILAAGPKFGSNSAGAGKKVLVEYSSPNIAKPFTIGHLRSTVIGDAIAGILSFSGYRVIRDNHLGDWGTQFGKQIVALRKWGSLANLEKSADKMSYLVDLYVKFHEESDKDAKLEDEGRAAFAALEKGDADAVALYDRIVAISKDYFKTIYSKLGVSAFDTEHGEHFYEPYIGKVKAALEKANLLTESEGAKLVFFPKIGKENEQGETAKEKYPPFMIEKKDGATLYATRDLATDLWRRDEYGADVTVVNEVGVEQTLHFRQLFEVESMLGWFHPGQRVHVAHGHYRFKEGKMATRKGNVIWLEDVIDEAEKRAAEINPETARAVGIGSIKFNDLKRESIQDIVFDWDELLNLRGDSCPYLQYSHARSKSIVAKALAAGIKPAARSAAPEAIPLEKLMYRFPEVVARAAAEYKPHYVATYLLELAGAFNTFYGNNQIVNATDPESSYRVALTDAFATVIKNGLTLLGIEVPEKM